MVGVILNDALRSVSFVQSVFAFDDVAIAMLPVAVDVAGFWIIHAVLELVSWMVVRLFSVLSFASPVTRF